jgi:cysteine synthase
LEKSDGGHMKEIKRILDFIGNAPLIKIRESVFAKLEAANTSGSMKDRPVLYLLETAE